MQSGGGMPSMSELMSDPTMRDLYVIIYVILCYKRTNSFHSGHHNSAEVALNNKRLSLFILLKGRHRAKRTQLNGIFGAERQIFTMLE